MNKPASIKNGIARSENESIPVAICIAMISEDIFIDSNIVAPLAGPRAYKQVINAESPIPIATGTFISRKNIKLTVRIITDVFDVSIFKRTFYLLLDLFRKLKTFFMIVSIEKTNMKKPLIGTAI